MVTEISTSLSSFASVDATLGFFNDLILDAVNNFIPRVSSSGKIRLPWRLLSVLPSLEPKTAPTAIVYGRGPEWTGLNIIVPRLWSGVP